MTAESEEGKVLFSKPKSKTATQVLLDQDLCLLRFPQEELKTGNEFIEGVWT